MNEKVLKTLEYNKIIQKLSGYASSDAGRSICEALTPISDFSDILAAQQETTDAVLRLRKRNGPALYGLKNILPSIKRLNIGGTLTMQELLEISTVLDGAASAIKFLKPESDDAPYDSLSPILEVLDPLTPLNNEIKRCIISYDEMADDASHKLKDIRKRTAILNQQIGRTLSQMVNSATVRTYLQDALVTMRNGRYCIPVKVEHRNKVPGMIHDQSASGSTLFIEPMAIVRLNNELKELALAEEAEIQIILKNLSSEAASVSEALEYDYRMLGKLDFILAKARYSEEIKGCAPEFNNDRYMDLRKARHPLLNPKGAVPISLSLGKEHSMLIVTGPNTGGKTVSLKTAGLLALMGQSGMHIPAADGSALCFFDEVYADIGDEQSIEQNLSTFSSHMTNLIQILKKADSHSLVLLDELCSGTDPTEGAALAQAILTFLHNMDVRCMATTHYSELKVFAMETAGVQNACCQFDVETLRPTYKLLLGLPGKSNAFAISGKLGLSEHIIDNARSLIDTANISFEDVLADIEENKKTAERERAEADELIARAKKTEAELAVQKEALSQKKADILRAANEEAFEILQNAKDFADTAIKDIRKTVNGTSKDMAALERKRAEAGKKVKESLGRISAKKKEASENRSLTLADLKTGTSVRVLSMGLSGQVTFLPPEKKSADKDPLISVQLGNMNMQVKLSDLRLISDEEAMQAQSGKSSGFGKYTSYPAEAGKAAAIGYSKALGTSSEIKLLGMTTDEALIELDKYLDDACMARLKSVRIVHGKGTGALRTAVSQYLRKQKRVKSFHLAEYGEGDSGVTIAELK